MCPVCKQCPHHLNPNPAVSKAQCHPVLYLTSPEDPQVPPPPPPPQLTAGSAEFLVLWSTHPALDSLPGPVWISSQSPDYLSPWSFSLVAFYQTAYFEKKPKVSKFFE